MAHIKEKEVLNTAAAARLLGLTVQAVRVAARAGKIPAYHPYAGSSKFIYRRSELLAGMIPAEE